MRGFLDDLDEADQKLYDKMEVEDKGILNKEDSATEED